MHLAQQTVTSRPVRKSEDDLTIVAEYPALNLGKTLAFAASPIVDDWMNGDCRIIGWLRTQGYAK